MAPLIFLNAGQILSMSAICFLALATVLLQAFHRVIVLVPGKEPSRLKRNTGMAYNSWVFGGKQIALL